MFSSSLLYGVGDVVRGSFASWKRGRSTMGRIIRSVSDMTTHVLQPLSQTCMQCGNTARVAYHTQRTVATLHGRHYLHLIVRRCHTKTCSRYHQPYRPEEEGQWALPHGEYGLDVIALVGMLRYRHHYSLVELHQALRDRGLAIGERTVLISWHAMRNWSPSIWQIRTVFMTFFPNKALSFWRSMGCAQMSVMKCCGSYVIVCLEKFCSPVLS